MISAKAKKLDLVLRRKSGESKFTEILIGDDKRLTEHREALSGLLSKELLSLVVADESVIAKDEDVVEVSNRLLAQNQEGYEKIKNPS